MEVKAFPQNLSELAVDKTNLKKCLVSGLFAETVTLGEKTRRFLTYLTPGLEYTRPVLIIAPPSGVKAEEYLEQSFLRAFADREKIFLHVMDPEGKAWDLTGEDGAFFNKVYMKVQARDFYITIQDNVYAMGIGEGADIAQQAAMEMTSEWSGLATFGGLSSAAMRNAEVTHGQEATGKTELSVYAQKCQLPVWMLWPEKTAAAGQVRAYWMRQNDAEEESYRNADADEIHFPNKVWKKSTVNEEKLSQVRITNNWNGELTEELFGKVWEFLCQNARHRSFEQKNLRRVKDPEEFGAERHTMEVNGMTRLWFEYVPERVRLSQKPAPLVVVMHGRGGSAETFFELSGMSCVAEERDFIAVFPEAGIYQQKKNGLRNVLLWNGEYMGERVDDVEFVCRVIEDVRARYNIDPSRIYACGQSSGGMMTAALAEARPELFAAVSPWSALRNPDFPSPLPTFEKARVPMLFLMGEHDWLCADREHGEMEYHVTSSIAEYLRNIIKLYELKEAPRMYTCGEISYYEYMNRENVPMLIVGTVRDMSHANYPRESWIAYDQFFAKFTRREDGKLLYIGAEAYPE